MIEKYICPICGFDGLEEAPFGEDDVASYEICPCCGFEFGFDAGSQSGKYESFRLKWIENGAKWFIPDRRPKDWDLNEQLKNIKQT